MAQNYSFAGASFALGAKHEFNGSNFIPPVYRRLRCAIRQSLLEPRIDEPILRKLERARPSFVETIVGRRGGLRSILSQVEAVAPTNATVLITDNWSSL